MRSYPKDLFQFDSIEELMAFDRQTSSADERRHRIYRQLFLSPVVYRKSHDDPDFYYLRNFRNRLREDIEEHSGYQFELYKNAALLVSTERKQMATLFPGQKAIMDIVMQLAKIVRSAFLQYQVNEFGVIRLTKTDFETMLEECKNKCGRGWSKAYREAPIKQLSKDALDAMIEWKMADMEKDTGMIHLYPLLGRLTAAYPDDFQEVN
jgi:uncharacterized protein (TIGR02678 family)